MAPSPSPARQFWATPQPGLSSPTPSVSSARTKQSFASKAADISGEESAAAFLSRGAEQMFGAPPFCVAFLEIGMPRPSAWNYLTATRRPSAFSPSHHSAPIWSKENNKPRLALLWSSLRGHRKAATPVCPSAACLLDFPPMLPGLPRPGMTEVTWYPRHRYRTLGTVPDAMAVLVQPGRINPAFRSAVDFYSE